jgi:GrpB-like predicted nucleotidyltransferase (UPF0157 family)
VPGLAAKPIIDTVLLVRKLRRRGRVRPALEAAGYVLRTREPEWHEHRLLKDANVNVHVFSEGCATTGSSQAFREMGRTERCANLVTVDAEPLTIG